MKLEQAIVICKNDISHIENLIKTLKGLKEKRLEHFYLEKENAHRLEYLNICLKSIESELNREKNKVLTFSDLKQMVGKPVWNWDYEIWELVASYNEEYDEVVIGTKRIREESYMRYYRWEKE